MLGTVLKRMLGRAHDVVAVTGARDALARLLDGEQYDVILCDLMMPEMTGMDLYAELLVHAPALAKRIVFMTGGAFTNRAREFLEHVDNERVEKPIDPKKLKALIERFVG
jgi:CheY-like chemotaxis protein